MSRRARRAPIVVSLLLILLAFALLGQHLIQADPNGQNLGAVRQPPSGEHWFGTDGLGRDLAARFAHGAAHSLMSSLVAVLVAALIGISSGVIAGLGPILADQLLSRCCDALAAFPTLLAALVVGSIARESTWAHQPALFVGVTVALVSWPSVFRLVRAELLRLRRSDRTLAARAVGARFWRTARAHLLPEACGPAIVPLVFIAASSVVVDAALGLVRLGAPPPTPSWGGLLADAAADPDRRWWMLLVPGMGLFAAVSILHGLGQSLTRDTATSTR
jgi:peptide/nickel transport system permease protein